MKPTLSPEWAATAAEWRRERDASAEAKPNGGNARRAGVSGQPERPTVPQVDEARPPAFSDEALALRFAERHAHDLRFVAAWNKWIVWNGSHWRFDDTLHAFDMARCVCREAAAECKSKAAALIASAKTVAAVERLARADRRIAATIDQWDADVFNPSSRHTRHGLEKRTEADAGGQKAWGVCFQVSPRRGGDGE